MWYRDFSGVFAILVCISTVMTRQHVMADVLAALMIAEGMLWLSSSFRWGGRLHKWMEHVERLIFCIK